MLTDADFDNIFYILKFFVMISTLLILIQDYFHEEIKIASDYYLMTANII